MQYILGVPYFKSLHYLSLVDGTAGTQMQLSLESPIFSECLRAQ